MPGIGLDICGILRNKTILNGHMQSINNKNKETSSNYILSCQNVNQSNIGSYFIDIFFKQNIFNKRIPFPFPFGNIAHLLPNFCGK